MKKNEESLMKQIAILSESIRSLESAHGDQSVISDLRKHVYQLSIQLNGENPIYVGGNINTAGGSVIFGNQNIYNIKDPKASVALKLFRSYLLSVAQESSELPLGIISPQFSPSLGWEVQLKDIYVDLDVLIDPRIPNNIHLAPNLIRNRSSLKIMLADEKYTKVVLIGDGGMGKTTFLNYLVYCLAVQPEVLPKQLRSLLPIRISLRKLNNLTIKDHEKGTARILWNLIRKDIADHLGAKSASTVLHIIQQKMIEEDNVVLLDGLDEVSDETRTSASLTAAIHQFAYALPKSRFILSTRPFAYKNDQWGPEWKTLLVAPFNDQQISNFVNRWYSLVRIGLNWEKITAERKTQQLINKIYEKSNLIDLAKKPLLLTLIASLHSSWGQLPDDRVELLEETTRLLMSRWWRSREERGKFRGINIAEVLQENDTGIRSAIEKLAYEVHSRQSHSQSAQEMGELTEGDILSALKPLLKAVPPDLLIDHLQNKLGILIYNSTEKYSFPHRLFQEYLAACYISDSPNFLNIIMNLIKENYAWWEEIILLSIGKAKRGGMGNLISLLNVLLPSSPIDKVVVEEQMLLVLATAKIVIELRLLEYEEEPHFAAIISRIRKWLLLIVEQGLFTPAKRFQLGLMLCQIGDPRFSREIYYLPNTVKASEPRGFVEVPHGKFVVGDPAHTKKSAHSIKFCSLKYDYWMAKYPVTVAQFGVFIADGGYKKREFWTSMGWKWRTGKLDQEVTDSYVRDWLRRHSLESRTSPLNWDQQNTFESQPVIGVSWFEACAYAKWLDDHLRHEPWNWLNNLRNYEIRLPTEVEWERAAKYDLTLDNKKYPWGDQWDIHHANLGNSLSGVSIVGMYPQGNSLLGIADMAGNIWEWTLSLDKSDSPETTNDHTEINSNRVVRGGCWADDPEYGSTYYRNWHYPINFFINSIGLRLCIGPILNNRSRKKTSLL